MVRNFLHKYKWSLVIGTILGLTIGIILGLALPVPEVFK